MIAYASRTGTKRQLRLLAAHGWRLLVSARGVLRTEGFRYALDNGAWTAFQRGEPFDESAFMRAVDLLGTGADWIVVPDIVNGGLASLEYSLSWLDRLRGAGPLLIAVQDGMAPGDVRGLLGTSVGIAIGGSTEWKEQTASLWTRTAHAHGAVCHMLRVNTQRRYHLADGAGVDSFDGSGVSRFADHIRIMQNARAQCSLLRGLS